MKGKIRMKRLQVVRLEGNYVICEDHEKKLFAIERGEAPKELSAGSVILISNEGEISVESKRETKRIW